MSSLKEFIRETISKPDERVVHQKDTFTAFLRHERERCDRSRGVFTLISFEAGSVNLKELLGTIRDVDEVGWLDEYTIGLMLYRTQRAGAQPFILRFFPEDAPYEISIYPPDWKKENRALFIGVPAWKRTFDIVFSSFLLLVLSPVFLLTSIYIKIVSPGPVLFFQRRVGLGGMTFKFYKFRSMRYNCDQDYHKKHITGKIKENSNLAKLDAVDPRIYPGGKLLRKLCIDELPQLINVLKGEMSLVGPRPCLPYEEKAFFRWYAQRFNVLPGMTGLWQVSGKNRLTLKQMATLDIKYAKNMSLWNDLKIIVMTIPAIIGTFGKSEIPKNPDDDLPLLTVADE